MADWPMSSKKLPWEKKIVKILNFHIFASMGPTKWHNPFKWDGKGHFFRLEPWLLCFVLYFKANFGCSVTNCSFFYPTDRLQKNPLQKKKKKMPTQESTYRSQSSQRSQRVATCTQMSLFVLSDLVGWWHKMMYCILEKIGYWHKPISKYWASELMADW